MSFAMATSTDVKPWISRFKLALLGLAGTGVASFLPGLLVTAIWTLMGGGDQKLGPGGTVAVLAFIWGVFTAVTLATYVIDLVPLFLVARMASPSHAFGLAAVASVLTAPSIATTEPVVVAGVHLVLFTILCVLYRKLVKRGPDAIK